MISIITPTWQRHDLLIERCMPSIAAQTYRNFEHVIVSDGSDSELGERLWDVAPDFDYEFRYEELPEHRGGLGEVQRLAGIEVAKGELIAYLDDDNAWRPNHLAALVRALEASDTDFAYGQMERHWPDGHVDVLGLAAPAYGQIDTSMLLHRRELLDRATWRPDYLIAGAPDWDVVERWMQAGATWAFVSEITLDYYLRWT